ncbi:hypothetical protein AM588_10003023 [Phytophthora nicotianae]|uniref:Uncharacterized protein n=1 Tax=Phytophthora nicotianae TaxID=4792 RepID=A0A0W8D4M4_PHYNI|nr:hypothetical protein AM588_10003023 [Phytophthora nicotianae]
MCEDLDFLDQVGDLVEWLGFGLLRNPFIVDRALDDIVSSRLQIIVHEDRSLKYWSSGSWRQNKRLANKKDTALSSLKPVEPQLTSVCKTHWKKYTPPQPLVKPLVGISPEDEVVSGSRTVAAQQILLDEESLHGRMQALKAVEEYVDRGPSVFEHNSVDKNAESPVVYEVIAALNSLQKGCREKYRQKTLSYIATCSNCAIIQHRRLHAVKELIIHAGAIAPEALEVIYHGYCERRAALLPPIIIVVASTMSSSMIMWLLPLLEHYFASFDCSKNGFLHFENDGHTVSEEGIHARETLLHVLARDQVAVLFNANCGVTVENANVFVHELHWWLYPDNHDLPCHVAYIVGDNNDVSRDSRDNDLLEALQSLNHAACQIAELDPVCLDDGDSESDRASAFDAYLVAEAVLVEATRVLLHPEYSWQKPREIIGASSWSSACSFLLDPAQLSGYLVQCNPLKLSVKTVEVLEAYFAHAKWPRDYLDVRPVFFGLLAFMMHLQHVRRILASRSGSLHNSLHLTAQDGIVVEREQLAKNTSVIDCSHVAETPPC